MLRALVMKEPPHAAFYWQRHISHSDITTRALVYDYGKCPEFGKKYIIPNCDSKNFKYKLYTPPEM